MNINFAEIAVIFLVALLLFGPEQLPQFARQLGKLTGDLRKLSNTVRKEWYNAVYPPASEIRRDIESGSQAVRQLKAEILSPAPGTQGTPTRPSPETPAEQIDVPSSTKGQAT